MVGAFLIGAPQPMFNTLDYRITHDPRDEASQSCLVINPRRHLVFDNPNWPWLSWLRRVTGNARLCVYKHLETQRFMLCVWAYSPAESNPPLVQELTGFFDDPTKPWPRDLPPPDEMRKRLRPAVEQLKAMRSAIQEKAYQDREGKRHDLEARGAAVKRLKKNGLDKAADELSIGAIPFVGPARSLDRNQGMIEALKQMRK